MANLSTFPEQIDAFTTHYDIQQSDLTNISRYKELMNKSRTSAEETELQGLIVTLNDKLITATHMNHLQNAIENIENFFLNETEGYIETKQQEFDAEIAKFTDRGVFSNSTQYYAKNFVSYDDGTGNQVYLCIRDSIGNLPTNTTYFKRLSIKGEQGASGLGLSFKGAWNSSTAYVTNDAVQYGGIIFGALQNNTNQTPNLTSDTAYWAKAWNATVTVTKFIGTATVNTNVSNVNFVNGEITSFNSTLDALEVYVNSTRLTKNVDYTLNANGQSIDKVSGTWDGTTTPIFFEFVVTKNVLNNVVFADGSAIQDGTVAKSKLTVALQNEITGKVSQGTIDTVNASITNLAGTGRTTETVKGVSDALTTHKSAGSTDHDNRYYTETELNNGQLNNLYYTETEINTKLDGLAGTGRTTETIKGNADSISSHVNNTSNPHGVTAAQISAVSSATFTAHANNTGNPHNVTASQIGGANILTELKTVDGTGSGLDADTLDGLQTGNANGNIPVSNGTVCTNLNAEMIGGKTLSTIVGVASKGLFSTNPYLSKSVSTTIATGFVTTVGTTPILCPYVGTVDLSADFTNIGGEVYFPSCSVTTQGSGTGTYTVDLLINDTIRATQTVTISGTSGTFNAVTLPATYFNVGNNTIKKRFTYVSDYRSNIQTAVQSAVYIMPKIIVG